MCDANKEKDRQNFALHSECLCRSTGCDTNYRIELHLAPDDDHLPDLWIRGGPVRHCFWCVAKEIE